MNSRLLLIALLVSFSSCIQLWGQKLERFKHQSQDAIKYNLTDMLVGRYSISYEEAFGSYFSFGSEFDIIWKDVFLESSHPWYISQNAIKRGFILEPYIRCYSSNFSGLYISFNGFFGFATYKLEQSEELGEPEWSAAGGTIQFGIQKTILDPLLIDFYLGATYANDDYPGIYHESTALFPPPYGIRLSGGLRIGILLKNQ